MVYVGVDLHRKSSHVAVLAGDGELLASQRIASRPEEFLRVFGGTVALVVRASVTETGAMRSLQHPCLCPAPRSAFAGYRFPPEVITLAVRWYLRFGLSYRDVEELLAERGIEVDHVSIYRWVQRFAPEFAEAARARQHVIGHRWHVDETYLKVGGIWRYLSRAIDQFGQVIDVFLSPRRRQRGRREVLCPSDGPDPGLTSGGHHRSVTGPSPRPR